MTDALNPLFSVEDVTVHTDCINNSKISRKEMEAERSHRSDSDAVVVYRVGTRKLFSNIGVVVVLFLTCGQYCSSFLSSNNYYRGSSSVSQGRPKLNFGFGSRLNQEPDSCLFAKKKGSKLISEDILSSLDSFDSEGTTQTIEPPAPPSAPQPINVVNTGKPGKNKDKALSKFGLSEETLSILEMDINESKGKKASDIEVASIPDMKSSESEAEKAMSAAATEATAAAKKKKKRDKSKKTKGIGAFFLDEDDDKDETADKSEVEEEVVDTMAALAAFIEDPVSKSISAVDSDANTSVFDEGAENDDSEKMGADEDEDEVPPVANPDGLTAEQRIRKERGSSRVRFAESSQPDFVMMELEKVGIIYGNNVVIKEASFGVRTGDRLGLVGPNGGGKTSLLKTLAGVLEPTTGDVVKSSRNLRLAFLRQEFIDELVPTRTLKDELFSSFEEEQTLLRKIAECEVEVGATTDDPEKMEEVLNRLQVLQDEAISRGVYSLESKVEKIMDSTGFASSDADALVSSFSGGWKMRIGLAKILLKDPNILLLDEPTNHLDLESVMWLEEFLQKQSIPMVIVSHDREFLDRVCNKIVDVEDGTTVSYTGNYSKFLEQKRARIEVWREKYERQTRFVKEEEKWIKKAKNDPNMAQQVRAKEQSLERLRSSEDWVEEPPREKKFRFRFPPAPRSGQSVVEGFGLGHGYGEGKNKVLFAGVDITVERGERVGFIGPNGSGKSTMMRLISGSEKPKSGTADFGSSNVEANYFAQSQADALDLEMSVLEAVQEEAPPGYSLTETRALLGQFMFKGDNVDKKIKVLSGGEKARVALCRMMLKEANLLLLDEPTNHLDITAKEVLEDAIQNFEGSVLIISHDRYFMSQVANTIFAFENQTVVRHNCDYHDFMQQRGALKDKVEARYVEGDRYRITNAKEVIVPKKQENKKNFGGSGVTSGNLFKGIKNAKRYQG